MEIIVVVIYVTAGLRIPLQNDYAGAAAVKTAEETVGLYPSGDGAYAPGNGQGRSPSSVSVSQKPIATPEVYAVPYNNEGY